MPVREKVDYSKVLNSAKAKDGITIDHIQAIVRILDLWDMANQEYFDKLFEKLNNDVSEVVSNSYNKIFNVLYEQTELMKEIKKDIETINKRLNDHERRIKRLENTVKKIPGLKIA